MPDVLAGIMSKGLTSAYLTEIPSIKLEGNVFL